MHIEKRRFDQFIKRYRKGKYGTKTLGQAFYDEFDLHKLSKSKLHWVLHVDDDTCMKLLLQGVEFD